MRCAAMHGVLCLLVLTVAADDAPAEKALPVELQKAAGTDDKLAATKERPIEIVDDDDDDEEEEAMAGHGQMARHSVQEHEVDWQGTDENPLCRSWALQGECIRNPQFMWVSCVHSCGSLPYADADADCTGWATTGECEKNPLFMFERCNKSCVDVARKSLHQRDHTARPNPHLAESMVGAEGGSRLSTFLPIFIGIGLLLAGGTALTVAFAPALAAKQEALEDELTRLKVRRCDADACMRCRPGEARGSCMHGAGMHANRPCEARGSCEAGATRGGRRACAPLAQRRSLAALRARAALLTV